MIDKSVAVELRKLGLSYTEISKQLGCSVGWCKKELKGIEKNVNESEAVKALVTLAKSPKAVTPSEIRKKVREVHPNDFSKEAKEQEENHVRRFKEKINKEDGTLIRKYWMAPGKAKRVHQMILEAAHSLTERLEEEVSYIREECELDSSFIPSLRKEIHDFTLEGSKQLFQPIEQYAERVLNMVNEMERRNQPAVRKTSMKRVFGDAYGIPASEVPY